MRNSNTGGVEVYDISPGETVLLLRNSKLGGLEVYNIANNQLTGAAFIGTVGLDWQFAGIAPIHAAGASVSYCATSIAVRSRCTILQATPLSQPLVWVRSVWIGHSVDSPPIRRPAP
jgi:hypothetical protein